MFADYRVPQILRHVNILKYSQELEQLVDNKKVLPYSSEPEVEIRAATVVAVERIMEQIRNDEELSTKIKCSYEVDWLLWQLGEKSLNEMKEHHRVLSIFY